MTIYLGGKKQIPGYSRINTTTVDSDSTIQEERAILIGRGVEILSHNLLLFQRKLSLPVDNRYKKARGRQIGEREHQSDGGGEGGGFVGVSNWKRWNGEKWVSSVAQAAGGAFLLESLVVA